MYDLYVDRVVRVSSSIDADSYAAFAEEMTALNQESSPILLEIHSEGGLGPDALAFVALMRMIESPVHTLAIGYVASAATLLLVAGHPGRRFMAKEAWCMVHEEHGRVKGTLSSIEREVKTLRRWEDQWVYLMSKYTGTSAKRWKDLHSTGDVTLNPKECKALGMVDRIV